MLEFRAEHCYSIWHSLWSHSNSPFQCHSKQVFWLRERERESKYTNHECWGNVIVTLQMLEWSCDCLSVFEHNVSCVCHTESKKHELQSQVEVSKNCIVEDNILELQWDFFHQIHCMPNLSTISQEESLAFPLTRWTISRDTQVRHRIAQFVALNSLSTLGSSAEESLWQTLRNEKTLELLLLQEDWLSMFLFCYGVSIPTNSPSLPRKSPTNRGSIKPALAPTVMLRLSASFPSL